MATLSEALQIALQHHQAGRLAPAEAIYRQILTVAPEHADALHLLGLVAHQSGRPAEAVDYIARAIGHNPAVAAYHNNLGQAYRAGGELHAAAECYRRAVAIAPDFAEAWNNLGVTLHSQGLRDEAAGCYRRAIELRPGYAEACSNLGSALLELGSADEAIDCCQRALALKPDLAEAWNNLGNARQRRKDLDEAMACYRRAWQLKPDYPEACNNLAGVLRCQGRLEEAIDCYERAIGSARVPPHVYSNYLCALRYHPRVTLAALHAAQAEYQRRFAAPLRREWARHENSRDLERRLVLGFVSPRFSQGPVGAFAIRALENLDRRRFCIVCYSDRQASDDMTRRFQAAADTWREVQGVADPALAEEIRRDQIDILFDLTGHSPENRMPVFARKPAPIQITWIDSVGGTGLEAMDYLLADRHEVPPEAEPYYVERVLRTPESCVCFDPPAEAPPVGPLPAADCGRVTFASFNQPAKFTARVVELWSRILLRVPRARLVLRYHDLDAAATRRHFQQAFAAHGVAPERVEYHGAATPAEMLRAYGEVDLALDPLYNGGLTTCEALWMGVPVITCPQETFAGRHSLSYLSTIGLTETIAGGLDEYVDVAVRLATDPARLASIREGLRARVAASPLCDGRRFAADLAELLRNAWHRWAGEVVCRPTVQPPEWQEPTEPGFGTKNWKNRG